MGMYDYLECQYPIPDTAAKEHYASARWQTKSLACDFTTYRILSDGELVEMHTHVAGSMVHEPFTGTLHFYDRIGRWWVDVTCEFDNGWLKKIHAEATE